MQQLNEYELEAFPELEFEFEQEYEGELVHEMEGEHEAEMFFGSLARMGAQAAQSPALRNLAVQAARSALRSGLGGDAVSALGSVSNLFRESEFEQELETE